MLESQIRRTPGSSEYSRARNDREETNRGFRVCRTPHFMSVDQPAEMPIVTKSVELGRRFAGKRAAWVLSAKLRIIHFGPCGCVSGQTLRNEKIN